MDYTDRQAAAYIMSKEDKKRFKDHFNRQGVKEVWFYTELFSRMLHKLDDGKTFNNLLDIE